MFSAIDARAMDTTVCKNSKPSPMTPHEYESHDTAHDAKLIEGESSLDVLNFSIKHAI